MAAEVDSGAALARGGRTNFFGFLLRLSARLPFLFVAGRLYGADALGRFAYATMVVEFVAALVLLGLKRGLAADMARGDRPHTHSIADAIALTTVLSAVGVALLALFPALMFPKGDGGPDERLFACLVPLIAISDVTLAGLAFRHRIAAQVRARSVIEPWVLTLAATALAFTALKPDGLLHAYALSMLAAWAASVWPCWREFGGPAGWRPRIGRMAALARANVPLAAADLVEWGARRLDIFILGRFASAEVVGIYYVAQQLATLPQKLRTTFDPVLAPVLATALRDDARADAAAAIRQCGFWVLAAQLGVVLWLSVFAVGWMGLFGPAFAAGALVVILLVLVELVAAQGSLAEAALVYARPRLNMVLGLGAIALQGALTLALVQRFGGEGAAAALLAATGLLAVAKSAALARRLGASVLTWRPSLLLATGAALALGLASLALPEWAELTVGAPAMLALYLLLMWRFGFGPADRVLFRRLPRP